MSFPSLKCRIDALPLTLSDAVSVGVLRLDLLHPVVSGNKWFKLKGYVAEAKALNKKTLLTFGGAYSNHIVATAAAATENGLKSIGVIRGEQPLVLSSTLQAARAYGMQFAFVSREEYKRKPVPEIISQTTNANDIYEIAEGGYGHYGMVGAKDILLENDTDGFTHIMAAVGTGTTVAGLVAAARPHQQIIGIPVLKAAYSLQEEIETLLVNETNKSFRLFWNYHFGGYAKYNNDLLAFMNRFYEQAKIPTDFVYTAKAFYAAFDLIKKGHFPTGSRLLLVHTGGLQGNASLKKEALIYG